MPNKTTTTANTTVTQREWTKITPTLFLVKLSRSMLFFGVPQNFSSWFVPHDEKVEVADLSRCCGPTCGFQEPVPPVPWTHSSLPLARPSDRMFRTFLSRCQLARSCEGGGDPVLSVHPGSAAPTGLPGLADPAGTLGARSCAPEVTHAWGRTGKRLKGARDTLYLD